MDDKPAVQPAPAEGRGWSCAGVGCLLLIAAVVVGFIVFKVSADLMCDQACEAGLSEGDVVGAMAMIYGGLAFIATPLVGGLVLLMMDRWPGD